MKGIRGELLQVQIFVDGVPITSAMVPLGSIGHMVSIPLEGVSPRVQARSLRCTVKLGSHEYTSHAELRYMPEKKAGSIVKLDRRTGGTWARRKGEWKSFIPFGWYDVSLTRFVAHFRASILPRRPQVNYGTGGRLHVPLPMPNASIGLTRSASI